MSYREQVNCSNNISPLALRGLNLHFGDRALLDQFALFLTQTDNMSDRLLVTLETD